MVDNTNVNTYTPYVNSDGLMVDYPQMEEQTGKGGTFSTMTGNVHCLELDVDYTDVALGTDATHNFILSYKNYLPDNCVVESVEFVVTEAWDSTSSDVALNFGTLQLPTTAGAYVIVDADGLMNTLAKAAIDTIGGTVKVSPDSGATPDWSTYVGAQVGTELTSGPYVVSCYWENHVPTSGHGKLRIYYRAHLE